MLFYGEPFYRFSESELCLKEAVVTSASMLLYKRITEQSSRRVLQIAIFWENIMWLIKKELDSENRTNVINSTSSCVWKETAAKTPLNFF